MISGIGVDLVSVARISEAMENPKFAERILRPDEMREEMSAQFLAGRWAAKEAIYKALGRPRLTWQDIKILNAASGAPLATVSGCKIHLSISHEREFAIAYAIAEVNEG